MDIRLEINRIALYDRAIHLIRDQTQATREI